MTTERVFSGAPWENQFAYCRAIRRGNIIMVSGTTAIDDNGKVIEPENAYMQTKICFKIIDNALRELQSFLLDVVRTRMFVTDISRAVEYGRAHSEVFKDTPPACSMIEVKCLITSGMLGEIEVDAIC